MTVKSWIGLNSHTEKDVVPIFISASPTIMALVWIKNANYVISDKSGHDLKVHTQQEVVRILIPVFPIIVTFATHDLLTSLSQDNLNIDENQHGLKAHWEQEVVHILTSLSCIIIYIPWPTSKSWKQQCEIITVESGSGRMYQY